MTTTATRPGPRERLIDAARELTSRTASGSASTRSSRPPAFARRSLYQHFGGKDQLVAEVLRDTAERDLQRYRDALDAGGSDPRHRLLSMFETLYLTVERSGVHGCRYSAAESGIADAKHPPHEQVRRYKDRLRALPARELRALGHRDANRAADQLLLLIDGGPGQRGDAAAVPGGEGEPPADRADSRRDRPAASAAEGLARAAWPGSRECSGRRGGPGSPSRRGYRAARRWVRTLRR